ncbi:phage tail protein [Granulicella sp. S190]|uniref:phage tail protein n=1 Tax=Granulicella sp. S190 TaxID=1747226 RepID=UPI00131D27EF|nr:phage tail protein [Granulicella sp. S190]
MKTKRALRSALSCILGLATVSSTAIAQDACVALLRHGIYNTVRSTQQGSSSSTIYNQICSNYSLYKSGQLQANASGSYGLISGSASFSKSDVEAIGSAMCSTGYSDATAANQIENFSSIVSPEGTQAFTACMKNQGEGLIVTTTFDEASPELVTIDAHYNRVGAGPNQNHVRGFNVQDGSGGKYPVSCTGSLKDAADHHSLIQSAVLSISCRRPIENDPTKAFPIEGVVGGLGYPASITIDTDIDSIKFAWGAIYLPPPVSPIPPAFIGEIRAVSFQPNSPGFTKLVANNWVECDGRALNAADYPDLYAALGNTWGTTNIGTTFKIPDLRGQFLRGWSHGSSVDPEAASRTVADPANPHAGWTGASGDSVGSRQPDALLNHVHQIAGVHAEAGGGNGFQGTDLDSNSNKGGPWQKNVDTQGIVNTPLISNSETRPKNVSVMYVIYAGPKKQ